jgi:hypothetical protein
MAATAQSSLPLPEISCVNPLLYRSALEQLFAEHERADHAEFFARAYPGAVAEGAKAWIGTDEAGRVVMHASRFPHRFLAGSDILIGGLIVNIMVAKAYRTHVPARALFDKYVADSRKEGDIDFLYTETTSRGANVLTGAGARVVGHIARFVLPITRGGLAANLAVRAYLRLRQRRLGAGRFHATRHAAEHFELGASDPPLAARDPPLGASDRIRGLHSLDLYRRRLKGYPTGLDHWVVANGADGKAVALVRGPEPSKYAWIQKLDWTNQSRGAAMVLAMVDVLREIGCHAVQIHTLAESAFADELRRAGFVERESQPFVALALSTKGAQALADIRKWQITDVDLDS